MEEKNEVEFRPCGTMMIWGIMAKMTPEEREEFERELTEGEEREQVGDIIFL